MLFGLGAFEILIILLCAVIFIGPKKLPQLAKTIGKGLRDFNRAKDGLMDEIHASSQETPPPESLDENGDNEQGTRPIETTSSPIEDDASVSASKRLKK